jgi:hypothetical protein
MEVDTVNQKLVDYFGIDTITSLAMWRIVWSSDQIEKRRVDRSEAGIHFLYSKVIDIKKYPYVKDRWILERLVLVPDFQRDELPVEKLSYEPIWVFYNKDDSRVPPTFDAAKFVIDTVYAALGKSSLAKYVDSEKNTTEEGRQQRIGELQNELFGDESGLYGKLHPNVGEGITVPSNYEKKE